MAGWNQQLFLLINASAAPSEWLVHCATVLAESPAIVVPAVLVVLWVWGQPDRRGGLLSVTAATCIALGINGVLGLLYFEPRPFMIGIGHTLLRHAPDNSFPSDHATFVWALGAGLSMTGAARRWGVLVCLYGVGVAWSRVYLGVHFPVDMIASIPVALVGGGIARLGQPLIAVRILPPVDELYEATLRILMVPPVLVPRQARSDRIPLQH